MLKQPSLEEAQEALLRRVRPLPVEAVPLPEALGRVLATDIRAPYDLPSYPLAALDGYAIPGQGVKGARFKIIKRLEPGEIPSFALEPGEAAAVVTGGPLPPGTRAVVRQEEARVDGASLILLGENSGENNIRPVGEDFRAGAEIARKGTGVTPGLIAVLAAFGIRSVGVYRRPRVLILNLGKEVVPHAGETVPGQVRDSNGPLLAALVKRDGGEPLAVVNTGPGGGAGPEAVPESMVEGADLLITVGGTASGSNDHALGVLRAWGAELIFRGVRIKPGSHSAAAEKDDGFVISLSGNSSACAVGYELLAAPVLRKLQGLDPLPARLTALCAGSFKRTGQRRFLWGRLAVTQAGLLVAVLPGQKSGLLRSLVEADALIDLPAGHPPLEPGTRVSVIPLLTPCFKRQPVVF